MIGPMAMQGTLYVTGDVGADGLLCSNADALMIGMLLDQQVPLEWAFRGPFTLWSRMGHLDPVRITELDEDEFVALCCEKPAIHRFPASMGRRVHALCAALVDEYGGDAEQLWADGPDAATLAKRLKALPGFGPEKTKIFIALLAKRFGIRPDGWERSAGVFADDQPRSIADCSSETGLAEVRAWKLAQKEAGKDKQDRPL